MPRKKKEARLVKYFIPAGAKEIIDYIVDGAAHYYNKSVWKQKFYHLCDYIANQNFLNELDVSSEYVNIHQQTMAKILGVDHHQMATILKDAIVWGLLIKDGIWKAAILSGRGKEKEYIEEGKSYGYQFKEWNDLTQIEIFDNRRIHEKILANSIRKSGIYDSSLKEYLDILSCIKVDETYIDETIKKVLKNKKEKKSQKEKYNKFIKPLEDKFYTNNNKQCIVIPFDVVCVPAKNDLFSKMSFAYLHSSKDVVYVPCQPSPFEIRTYSNKKKTKKVSEEESDETTIARCKRALYMINNGHMAPNRPDKDSRVFCEITNLNREFRTAIRLDGKKIVGLDIRNSQPLLAAVLFRIYYKEQDQQLPDDVQQYQRDCENGIFYDQFMNDIKLPDDLRPQFKQDFFRKVFFSKVIDKNNLLKDMFMKRYPNCWEAMCDMKGGLFSMKYGKFAKVLQAVEATIIFENVNMRLIRAGVMAFNIFDSIYVNSTEDLNIAKQYLVEAFAQVGIRPTLNEEYLQHLNNCEAVDGEVPKPAPKVAE